MAVIKIINFGGEIPRVSDRALPADAAQINSNLLATSTEFRPLLGDSTIGAVPSGTKTLHRLIRNSAGALLTDPAAGWIAETADKNYVKGQIADDATERTYVSFNDGSAPPRAIDATGANRVLGVPKPTGLTATANITDEFTVDDAISAESAVVTAISTAIKASMDDELHGNGITMVAPTSTTIGWQVHGAVPGMPSTTATQANLCIPVSGGNIHESFTFLKDAKYGGREVGGYFAVAIDLTAKVWVPVSATLSASLSALKDPSDLTGVAALFDSAEVASVVASSASYWSVTSEPIQSSIATAVAASNRLRGVIDALDSPATYSTAAYAAGLAVLKGGSYAAAGEGFKRVFLQAAVFAGKPEGGEVATSSRYWIPFGEATSFGYLAADMESCISVDATGFRSFDFAKFANLLTADFTILINQRSDKDSLLASLQGKVEFCLTPYREFFSVNNLKALGGTPKTSTDRMISFDGAVSELSTALAALSAMSESMRNDTTQAGKNAYALGPQSRISSDLVVRQVEDRYYITTVVTDWGEESAPSDPTERLEIDQNDSVTLAFVAAPTGRNLAKRRIYRGNSGSTATAFQFTDEIPIGTMTYTDTKKASELGEPCPTIGPDGITYWLEPATRLSSAGTLSSKANSYLRGLTGMPNGVMAGHVDNFVAFCEPYAPYAWPIQYQIALKHEIVGLGAFGQSLFVGTFANPSIITGSDSASMSEIMLDDAQACSSARSIVSAGSGVLYASPDGICFANSGGVEVITGALFAREDWTALSPESIVAVMHEGVYYFWYTGNGGGCYALDMVAKKLARVDMPATAVFADSLTDAVFYTTGTSLKRAFSTGRRTGTWKSAKLEIEAQAPLAWGKVMGDQTLVNPITLTWMGDGALRYTKTVTDTQPWRLPPGRYLEHEVQISGTARVTKVFLASTTDELKGIT